MLVSINISINPLEYRVCGRQEVHAAYLKGMKCLGSYWMVCCRILNSSFPVFVFHFTLFQAPPPRHCRLSAPLRPDVALQLAFLTGWLAGLIWTASSEPSTIGVVIHAGSEVPPRQTTPKTNDYSNV